MNAKTTSIIAYITWIGLIVAFCAGDREGKIPFKSSLSYYVIHFIICYSMYWMDLGYLYVSLLDYGINCSN